MGVKLWNFDSLLMDLMRPMFNAYGFQQYETAAKLLYQLNSLIIGFGEGVDKLPIPKHIPTDIWQRGSSASDYKRYYEYYSPIVLVKMGKYIRSVLDALPNQIFLPTDNQASI